MAFMILPEDKMESKMGRKSQPQTEGAQSRTFSAEEPATKA